MTLSDIFGGPAAVVVVCPLIAFLVSYALFVEVASFRRERTVFAGTLVALTVLLIAASLVAPIRKWAPGVDQTGYARPLTDDLKRH